MEGSEQVSGISSSVLLHDFDFVTFIYQVQSLYFIHPQSNSLFRLPPEFDYTIIMPSKQVVLLPNVKFANLALRALQLLIAISSVAVYAAIPDIPYWVSLELSKLRNPMITTYIRASVSHRHQYHSWLLQHLP